LERVLQTFIDSHGYRPVKKYALLRIASVGLYFQILVATCCAGSQVLETKDQYVEESKMPQLHEMVLALDLSAADLAKMRGVAAIPELIQLMEHPDNAVQMVAIIAMGEINHPEAFAALLNAATAEDSSVAGTAVDQLCKHGRQTDNGQFLTLLPSMKSGDARSQLILCIGKTGDEKDRERLQSFCEQDKDPQTELCCTAALARLGSEESRKKFSERLLTDRNLRTMDLAHYIGQQWLLPSLGKLLRDEDPIQSLGDPPPGFPSMLRVCDKAVVLIADISGKSFSFATNVHMNYSADQLAEAARIAGARY
jgi:HEAT repeat protein